MVIPILWRGARTVGRETLLTGGKILTDSDENDSPDEKPGDIVSTRVIAAAQNVISKLPGRGRECKKTTVKKCGVKKPKLTKRDIS